jgi:DNA primase
MAVAEELAKLEASRGSAAEISEAMIDMTGLVDEGLTWRLGKAAEARNKANRSSIKDGGSEAGEAEILSKHLQNLIDGQVWVKKKR